MVTRFASWIKALLDSIDGDERFVVVMSIGLGCLAALFAMKLTGGEFVTCVGWIFTTYVGARAVENTIASNTTARVAEAQAVATPSQTIAPSGTLPK